MNNRFNLMLKECESLYPEITKKVVDGYSSGVQEITLLLSDDMKLVYDHIAKTIRFCKPVKENQTEAEWRKEFGIRLSERLYKAGITQQELSERTKISQSVISKYINGQATPSVYNLMRIADVIDYSLSGLTYFN